MKWLLPPTSTSPGFCIGDKVQMNRQHATVIPAEGAYAEKFGHALYDCFVPVVRKDGVIIGWSVDKATVVERALQMSIRGNELHLNAP
jgi:hypothetical protein